MIFMSQSGITDPARAADWDRWYVEHLKIMLSVNGVNSTQRFKLVKGDQSPSLAMYSFASAALRWSATGPDRLGGRAPLGCRATRSGSGCSRRFVTSLTKRRAAGFDAIAGGCRTGSPEVAVKC